MAGAAKLGVGALPCCQLCCQAYVAGCGQLMPAAQPGIVPQAIMRLTLVTPSRRRASCASTAFDLAAYHASAVQGIPPCPTSLCILEVVVPTQA